MTLFWFLCALLPPVLYSISNLVDQYIARDHLQGAPFAFLALSGLSNLPVLVGVGFFALANPQVFDVDVILYSSLAAIFFFLGMIPYFLVIAKNDVAHMMPVYQTVPFFLGILCWVFLHEILTIWQILGGVITILAAIFSTLELKKLKISVIPLILIFLSCWAYAFDILFMRLAALSAVWYVVTFWLCATWFLLAVGMILFFPAIRQHVIRVITYQRGRLFGLVAFQQVWDIGAGAATAAALAFPVATTVTILVGSIHPFVLLFFSFLAARLIPSIYTFTLTRRDVLYKIACFALMMAGLALVVGVDVRAF